MCDTAPETALPAQPANIVSESEATVGVHVPPGDADSLDPATHMTSLQTRKGTVTPAFSFDDYVPMSPLLPAVQANEFIHQIVTGNISSSTSSYTASNAFSVADAVSSTAAVFNTAPTYAVPQLVNFDILDTLPGSAILRQGLGGLPLVSSQPNVPQITSEWQRTVSDSLAALLSNQQVILNELNSKQWEQ